MDTSAKVRQVVTTYSLVGPEKRTLLQVVGCCGCLPSASSIGFPVVGPEEVRPGLEADP